MQLKECSVCQVGIIDKRERERDSRKKTPEDTQVFVLRLLKEIKVQTKRILWRIQE